MGNHIFSKRVRNNFQQDFLNTMTTDFKGKEYLIVTQFLTHCQNYHDLIVSTD